jgi:type II secretory pathway pseudopilin PulG
MSNVLIGIIGVILFIGLALAGALFLGPRFQQSTANAKAATIVQALQQIQSAENLYRTVEGKTIPSGSSGEALLATLRSGSYLKARPVNPFAANATDADIVYHGGNPGAGQDGTPMVMSFTYLPDTTEAHDACFAIERQMGNPNPAAVVDAVGTTFLDRYQNARRPGCLKYSGGYLAFIYF